MHKRKTTLSMFELHDDLYLKKHHGHRRPTFITVGMTWLSTYPSPSVTVICMSGGENVLGRICTKQLRTHCHILNTKQKLRHQVRKQVLLWGFYFSFFYCLFLAQIRRETSFNSPQKKNSKGNEVLPLLNCTIL